MENLRHVVYINLEDRTDRNEHFLEEMTKIGLNHGQMERFNAIKKENGALGCSMSHLKCIQNAKNKGWESVLIMEDDVHFVNSALFHHQLETFFRYKKQWDVLLLAGNNMLPYKRVDSCCIQVFNCLTTTAYIVQNHYYDTLIDNYKEGILKLMKNPDAKREYAIDKYWLNLQIKDKWLLLIPTSIIQYANYSDIEERDTDFTDYMLNYNKVVERK